MKSQKIKFTLFATVYLIFLSGCNDKTDETAQDQKSIDSTQVIQPIAVTEALPNDTDDPAIWVNPENPEDIIVVGTDKESNGGLYAFDLEGKIREDLTYIPLKRPNNVDIEYGFEYQGKSIDIAVVTERESNKIRVVSLPDFKLIDNGGIEVFADDTLKAPMGIALYKNEGDIYAIVSRKSGPENGYLYQYLLKSEGDRVVGEFVRSFGKFSGIKEIESIAVDDELGFVYYSDENVGVRKYYAHPDSADREIALLGEGDFQEDNEGISIYDTGNGSGYVIVSDQQRGTFNFYERESGEFIGAADVAAVESDGSEVLSKPIGEKYPMGLFVAMSDDKTFHYYDMRELLEAIGK